MKTKEKILLTTLELASDHGLGQVSLSHIANKVGIQKPSLYNHFASKEDLIVSLYEYLREQAKKKASVGIIDYGKFVKGKSAYEVLVQAVSSYMNMNQDENMMRFYKFIMSERSIKKEAAKIMISETETMILSTKQLFYAMQVQQIIDFKDADMAAFSFAMTVQSIINYSFDQIMAGEEETAKAYMKEYIKEFCRLYKAL